jgi:repressor LexA
LQCRAAIPSLAEETSTFCLTFTFCTPIIGGGEKVNLMKLTKRQKEILDFLTDFMEREGYSPSMEEIAAHFQFASLNAVFKHLEALEMRGYLRRDANRARSIELSSERQGGVQEVALLGSIAAGKPIEAVTVPETLAVPETMLSGRGPHFILKVNGDSMIEDHIQDGDFVIVDSRSTALAGEMVVALVDRENATLKRFYPEGEKVRLQPANPNMPPIFLDSFRIDVQGVVVGIMRKYR